MSEKSGSMSSVNAIRRSDSNSNLIGSALCGTFSDGGAEEHIWEPRIEKNFKREHTMEKSRITKEDKIDHSLLENGPYKSHAVPSLDESSLPSMRKGVSCFPRSFLSWPFARLSFEGVSGDSTASAPLPGIAPRHRLTFHIPCFWHLDFFHSFREGIASSMHLPSVIEASYLFKYRYIEKVCCDNLPGLEMIQNWRFSVVQPFGC
ncbi:hypothetical protein CEXT_784791 [Caerostris extrusa]|uniref:Uncharacterized protein n=1 Tax=Caerostris extrusa TaxID=172846 RepID=A0AAV4S0A6_CAEEX|nr:hypothetical protein CEXT_784791 [Caerostris extrusa]